VVRGASRSNQLAACDALERVVAVWGGRGAHDAPSGYALEAP
jgi:hypothetical protein